MSQKCMITMNYCNGKPNIMIDTHTKIDEIILLLIKTKQKYIACVQLIRRACARFELTFYIFVWAKFIPILIVPTRIKFRLK